MDLRSDTLNRVRVCSACMRGIHQLVAGFSKGDAISNEAIVLRDLFRSWGYSSEIFAESKRILPELRGDALDAQLARDRVGPEDIVLLHLSIGSLVNDLFPQLPGRKVILYHNITPPGYFRGVQEEVASNLAKGREQARQLAGVADVNLADSRYNADELVAMGFSQVEVLPLVLDLEKLEREIDRRQLKALQDDKTNILFVGRCVPNKRIEDLLYAFHYYQQSVDPVSRLILAGSYAGMESYQAYQLTIIKDLKLRDVIFTHSIPQPMLNACYRAADVFVCMSEHEGFCIPVIESMVMGVPVLAYAAAAVPETMDGAGVLIHEKRFDWIAEMLHRLVRGQGFRKAVLAGQAERVQRYRSLDLEARVRDLLAPLLASA